MEENKQKETLFEGVEVDNTKPETDTVTTTTTTVEENSKPNGNATSKWIDLAKQYADGEDVASEDEAFEIIGDELESLTEWKKEEIAVNKRLIDALNAEPDMKALIGYVLQGASLREAIARTLDIESLTPAEDDIDRPKWDAAKNERLSRLKEMEEEDARNVERIGVIGKNFDNTKSLIASFAEKHRMTPEDKHELEVKLAAFAQDILDMKVDEDTLDMIYKSMRMDDIIEEAKEEGAIGERNRKIEVMRAKKGDTDGLPSLDAGMGESEQGLSDVLNEQDEFFGPVFEKRGRSRM